MLKIGDYLINKGIVDKGIVDNTIVDSFVYEIVKFPDKHTSEHCYVAVIGRIINLKFTPDNSNKNIYIMGSGVVCYTVVDNDLRNHINKLLTFQ